MRPLALLTLSLCAPALQAADPALLNLVMPDAKVLAGINVQKAKTTPFGQFLLTQLPAGDGLDSFIKSTGFDPRQDLTELLMASGGDSKSGLILARGNFPAAQIAGAIDKDGKHATQMYKGARLITGTAAGDNGAAAFLSSNIAVVGDLVSVKAAIDRSSAMNAIDPGLAAKVASFAATDAWSISIAGITFPDGKDNPLSGPLKSIQQASGSIMLSSPVQITAEATAQTDQDATSLSDVLRFAMMMLQSSTQSAAPAAASSILNSLNITTDHSVIKVQLSIPEDQLEELIKGAKSSGEKPAKKQLGAHV